MFYDRDTPSVALIGQTNVQHFPTMPLNKRDANVLACIHQPLVATLNQRETLVSTLNKRETLIHIYLHKRENPVMKFPLNQG